MSVPISARITYALAVLIPGISFNWASSNGVFVSIGRASAAIVVDLGGQQSRTRPIRAEANVSGRHLGAAAAIDYRLAGGGGQHVDRTGLCEGGEEPVELLVVVCFGDEVEGVFVVSCSLSLDGHAVLRGAGRREVVEQHRAHGGISGGAAFGCMPMDRNEEGHAGTPFDWEPVCRWLEPHDGGSAA